MPQEIIKIPSSITTKKTLVFLHGLGASAEDLVPLFTQLQLKNHTEALFLSAPHLPVTINNGFVMPAWYDIDDLRLQSKENVPHLLESMNFIKEYVKNEANSENIAYLGFSQGGAVALQLAAESACQAAFICSAYLVRPVNSYPKNIPTYFYHGCDDDIVPISAGRSAFDRLISLGGSASWREYQHSGHEINWQEIADLKRDLQALDY